MANTNIKYLKENNLYEAHKHFMQLAEASYGRPFPEMIHGVVMDEEGEQDPNAAAPGGDPNAMGGAPAGDPNAMGGGMPGADPNAMGADPNAAAGGDPNAMGGQDMGADPNAMGQPMPDASAPIGPDTGEDPFADQRGDDEPAGDEGEMDGDTIDIEGLTTAQEKLDVKQNQVGRDLAKVDDRIIKLIDTIKGFQDKLDQNNSELENLKAEFEKRNPTQTEKLDMRGVFDSFPFNVTPDGFWSQKMKERNNYELYADNDKPVEDQYTITDEDLEDTPTDISQSFSITDDDIQTLDKMFKL